MNNYFTDSSFVSVWQNDGSTHSVGQQKKNTDEKRRSLSLFLQPKTLNFREINRPEICMGKYSWQTQLQHNDECDR